MEYDYEEIMEDEGKENVQEQGKEREKAKEGKERENEIENVEEEGKEREKKVKREAEKIIRTNFMICTKDHKEDGKSQVSLHQKTILK